MKCSCLLIPRLWSHRRCTCPHPDHPSQQPTSPKSMKKVTTPARRIHNASHQSNSVAACHMREKRWGGDKSEKGNSIVRTSTSIDQTKCWQCCSCEYVLAAHQHRSMCVATSCTASQHLFTPTIVTGRIQHNQSMVDITACHTNDVRWSREGESEGHHHDNITSANQTKCWHELQARDVRWHSEQRRPLPQPNNYTTYISYTA